MPIKTRNKTEKPYSRASDKDSAYVKSLNKKRLKAWLKWRRYKWRPSPNVPSNLVEAERLIALAAEQGAKLVVLPGILLHHGC